MKISSVGTVPFRGYFYLQSGDNIEPEKLKKENKQTKRAERFKVDVPIYQKTYDKNGSIFSTQYETKGEVADLKTNPVSKKHLKNLFKNLYYLDRAGIYHNDLDPAHLFFADDGGVEIDCFRFSLNFVKKTDGELKGNDGSIRTPDFMMPSNESALEEQFLGGYLSKMNNEEDKNIFMKNYLKERSYYHQKRADMLINRGFMPDDDTVQFEIIQSKVFKNPSDEVIEFNKQKAELLGQKRAAFTEWDEGDGACNHPVDPVRRFNSIIMHLDCIKDAMELKNKAQNLAGSSKNDDEQRYFEFELKCEDLLLKNLYNDTKGMGEWNFKDNIKDIYLAGESEMNMFSDMYSEIDITKPLDKNKDKIEKVQSYYEDLSYDWRINCEDAWMERYAEKCGIQE